MPTIYLNHAGTSWPKPISVQQAVAAAMTTDPEAWNQQFEAAHREIAEYFHLEDPQQLLLTPGCTSSLSVAVADLPWRRGDRVLTSGFEHHALHRPLVKLADRGVELKIIPPGNGLPIDLDLLRDSLRNGKTRLVAVSAASNVTGEIFPLDELTSFAHEFNSLVLVDAAQVVGWMDLDLPKLGADLVAFGGHKGLQAPWGIGGLYVKPALQMECVAATCEVPRPGESSVCGTKPNYCDAGSVDRIALAGLQASIRWLKETSFDSRLQNARHLTASLWQTLEQLDDVQLLGTSSHNRRLPTIAFTSQRQSPDIAQALARRGIIVAAGLQCAPLAHQTLTTAPHGAVRISLGPATTAKEIARCEAALKDLLGR